jgi:hypothetical protein
VAGAEEASGGDWLDTGWIGVVLAALAVLAMSVGPAVGCGVPPVEPDGDAVAEVGEPEPGVPAEGVPDPDDDEGEG